MQRRAHGAPQLYREWPFRSEAAAAATATSSRWGGFRRQPTWPQTPGRRFRRNRTVYSHTTNSRAKCQCLVVEWVEHEDDNKFWRHSNKMCSCTMADQRLQV